MSLIHGGDFSSRHAKWLKKVRVRSGEISCGFCGYHDFENKTSKPKNWKPRRKDHGRGIALKYVEVEI